MPDGTTVRTFEEGTEVKLQRLSYKRPQRGGPFYLGTVGDLSIDETDFRAATRLGEQFFNALLPIAKDPPFPKPKAKRRPRRSS